MGTDVPEFLVNNRSIPKFSEGNWKPGTGGQGPYPALPRKSPVDESTEDLEFYSATSTHSRPSPNAKSSPKQDKSRLAPPVPPIDPKNLPWPVNDPKEWTEDRVQWWLSANGFTSEWRDRFRALNIHGESFFALKSYAAIKKVGIAESPHRFVTLLRGIIPQAQVTAKVPRTSSESISDLNSSGSGGVSEPDSSGLIGARRTSIEKFLFLAAHLRPHRKISPGPSVLVTTDGSAFTLIDVSGIQSGFDLRKTVYSALYGSSPTVPDIQLQLMDYFCVPGAQLNDEQLWMVMSAAAGDIVKFYAITKARYPRTPAHLQGSSYFELKRRQSNGETLVPLREAPKPPLDRSLSSKYRPELSPKAEWNDSERNPEHTSEQDEDEDWQDAPELSDEGEMWAAEPQKTDTSAISENTSINQTDPDGTSLIDWASRPPAQVLYENLEQFFPNTDLDRPAPKPETPISPVSPAPAAAPKTPAAPKVKPSLSRTKSIRVVAREASKRFTQPSLVRRSSTKMWGQRVVEMGSGGLSGPSLVTLRDLKQYMWIRGDLIGQGSFGKVYLGLNATTGDMMAVKQVKASTKSQTEDMRSLYAEVENMKDLDHLNIVQYLGFERLDRVSNLFLEYVAGGSVKSLLINYGAFPETTIRFLVKQALDGLSYLHSRGILHRDLKADNLLLDIDGTLKISDFGISKRSRDIYANNAEMSMQGTIFWMAPEVIHNVVHNRREGYSAKIDVWSLGCVVLEMFVGKRPWSTEEAVGAMYKLGSSRQAPPIPDDANVSVPGKKFINSCFTIEPKHRPTASELQSHEFTFVDKDFNFGTTKLGAELRRSARQTSLKLKASNRTEGHW